ncbi:MAG: glycosyl hydrolase family 32, partial [Bacteroidota bacterium]
KTIRQEELLGVERLFSNPTAVFSTDAGKWTLGAGSSYEIFCFQKPSEGFIWEGLLTLEGMGKFGLVCDMDREGNGYYISFNVSNGQVLIRAWGFNPLNNRQNFIFNDLQSGFFTPGEGRSFRFSLIRYGHYIELSIDDEVKLTLIDYTYSGNYIGLYTASSLISLQDSELKTLEEPEEEYASQEEAQV